MNDQELRKLWQQQPLKDPPPTAQIMQAMQKQTTQLRRLLAARDIREMVGGAIIIIIFGIFFFTVYRTLVSRLGDLIVIGSTLFIVWKLIRARRATPPAPQNATLVECLQAELKVVRAQSRLLGSVLWWYLLPGLIGLLVATWGMEGKPVIKIACTLFFIAVDVWVYWINQRARVTQLLPVEKQLESLLHSARTGDPLVETDFANLQPVISSISADQVKPAEFKIRATSLAAFWRIAFWGEIGFVGIWFFWIVSFSLDHPDWKTPRPALGTIAPTALLEPTNRYSGVAQRIVELLNAGDYAAVQKLYDADMSKLFPVKQTSEFYSKLSAQFGNVQQITGPVDGGYQGWTAFRLNCQRGEVTMSLALGANDKVSGIYFQPVARPAMSFKTFLSLIFNWPRLLWMVPLLVPFVLVGLLYSWLLLRLVELLGLPRDTVGISSLGIHFHRGQTLIPWHEIKDLRPFRMLHVRNLRLIQDSGGKTILPWTDLENHADVRVAVETFAPPNHLIRQHLPLLKRTGRS